MAARCRSRRAPLTSSATTIGGNATMPWASPSSSAEAGRPEKKSIQTDVSTTRPLTRLVQVDLQVDLASQGHGLLVSARSAHHPKTRDERLRDAFAGHVHGGVEQIAGEVGRHTARLGHTVILTSILITVNIQWDAPSPSIPPSQGLRSGGPGGLALAAVSA